MDFAVINALGQDHWRHTAVRAGSAADVYSAAKATRNDISNKCSAAGYRFWPIVHEIQGGMAKDANAAMRAICDAVGKKENTDATTVRGGVLGPSSSGHHSRCNKSGAETYDEKTYGDRVRLASHGCPASVEGGGTRD